MSWVTRDITEATLDEILSYGDHERRNVTFDLFPQFPVEVRLKIWKAALDSPHVIQINALVPFMTYIPCPVIELNRLHYVLGYSRVIRVSLLWACKESRYVAEEVLQSRLIFPRRAITRSFTKTIKYNSQTDLVVLRTGLPNLGDFLSVAPGVTSLVVMMDDYYRFGGLKWLSVLFQLPTLQNVYIMSDSVSNKEDLLEPSDMLELASISENGYIIDKLPMFSRPLPRYVRIALRSLAMFLKTTNTVRKLKRYRKKHENQDIPELKVVCIREGI
jgi:hypothetical protein